MEKVSNGAGQYLAASFGYENIIFYPDILYINEKTVVYKSCEEKLNY